MSTILLIIIVLLIILILFVIKNKGREVPIKDIGQDDEYMVCRDIAEIYCNTISCLDTLCGINSSIKNSLDKFLSSVSLNGSFETHQQKSLEDEIHFRLRETNDFEKSIPDLRFHLENKNRKVLFQHNLTLQDISCVEACVSQSIKEVQDNFNYLNQQLTDNQNNLIGVHFALARLVAFQYECNALFYGAMEGMCSFPVESLNVYYEMAPRWVNMPMGITIKSLNKEGFRMYQEMEFNKAQQSINAAKDYIENYENDVDNFIKGIKRKGVNFFIAGSKSLQQERDIFAGVINLLQSQWKPLGIDVNSYSYQNFPKEVSLGGHQQQYNHFIATYVNVSVFILSGKAGAYTMEEFEVALENLKKSGKPKIFVYSLNDENNNTDSLIHTKMEQEKQYWIEYKTIEELRLMLERDLNKYLLDEYSKLNSIFA